MRFINIDELWRLANQLDESNADRVDQQAVATVRRRLFINKSVNTVVEPYPVANSVFPLPYYPPQSIEHLVLDARGDANQHTNYIIPIRNYPKRAGTWLVDKKFTFMDAEMFIMEYFKRGHNMNIHPTSITQNRNIDLQRIENDFCQSIEVKLTSGHYKTAPGIIRSSVQQLDAMLNYQHDDFKPQLVPSLYAIVSCDFLKFHNVANKKWYATVWFIPVYYETDFLVFNTLNQGRDIDGNRLPPRQLQAFLRQHERRNDRQKAYPYQVPHS